MVIGYRGDGWVDSVSVASIVASCSIITADHSVITALSQHNIHSIITSLSHHCHSKSTANSQQIHSKSTANSQQIHSIGRCRYDDLAKIFLKERNIFLICTVPASLFSSSFSLWRVRCLDKYISYINYVHIRQIWVRTWSSRWTGHATLYLPTSSSRRKIIILPSASIFCPEDMIRNDDVLVLVLVVHHAYVVRGCNISLSLWLPLGAISLYI